MYHAVLLSVLNYWLADVYVFANVGHALALLSILPAGGMYLVQQVHVVDRHSIRFYAPDSEQEGLLARQQEIENLQRDLKARQLIADEAIGEVSRAESAWQQVSSSLAPARQRVAELTRRQIGRAHV